MKTLNQLQLLEAPLSGKDHGKALRQTGFWGSAGSGCLFGSLSNKKFLVPLRSSEVEQPHTWGTWGGAIDETLPNNDRKALDIAKRHAMRELKEESGFRGRITRVEKLAVYKQDDFIYFNFLFLTNNHKFKIKLDWETERAEWFTLDELYNLENKHFGLQFVLDNSRNKIVKSFK